MADTYLQIRTNSEDKKLASEILANLGTNLSTVLNMTIKQIILRKGIPFDVCLEPSFSVRNTLATMSIEGMPLTEDETKDLIYFDSLSSEEQEEEIKKFVAKYKEEPDE